MAQVVLGANFGDEGKGLITDYLSSQSKEPPLNVLFNGGSQRGHTVELEGIRHVFHHFGSGTFNGSSTLLTKDFICNPMVFLKEYEILSKLGYKPKVYMDQRCKITTPYDIAINQMIEESRDNNKHGSCGLGIYETIYRYKNQSLEVPMMDREEYWEYLKTEWIPLRLNELHLEPPPKWEKILNSDYLGKNFYSDYDKFLELIEFVDAFEILARNKNAIFEGGQGLLLDQNYGYYFPYLTPSNTGLTNVHILAKEAGITELEVYYVTRWYVTRHGAGPLMHETDSIGMNLKDRTNLYNDYQGFLRYGKLDLNLLNHTITRDLKQVDRNITTNPYLVMTCLDQADRLKETTIKEAIKEHVKIPLGLLSYGPTRKDVKGEV
jgi:adenylosuccinate synthase